MILHVTTYIPYQHQTTSDKVHPICSKVGCNPILTQAVKVLYQQSSGSFCATSVPVKNAFLPTVECGQSTNYFSDMFKKEAIKSRETSCKSIIDTRQITVCFYVIIDFTDSFLSSLAITATVIGNHQNPKAECPQKEITNQIKYEFQSRNKQKSFTGIRAKLGIH